MPGAGWLTRTVFHQRRFLASSEDVQLAPTKATIEAAKAIL